MNALEFGVGYLNGGAHKPIHTAYSAIKAQMGIQAASNLIKSDSPQMRAFAARWIEQIGFQLHAQRKAQILTGNWTLTDEEQHKENIQHLHNVMRDEVEANLAEPMNDEEMAEFVLEEYEKHYPRDKELKALRAMLEGKAGEDGDEWYGSHTFYL